MYWILGIIGVILIAFIIIRLTIDTNKNPDSNLGILDHPSTYKKPDIEMVDKSITVSEEKDNIDDDTTVNWDG